MKTGMDYKHYDSGQFQVGVFFIGFAILGGILIVSGAKDSASPLLFLIIFGGIFVGIPAVMGSAIVREQLQLRKKLHNSN